jgi:hypothetical protein
MVKRKSIPTKHIPKKPRADLPQHATIYKGVKFIDIPTQIGVYIVSMMEIWNEEAFKRIKCDGTEWNETEWNETMEIKPTHSSECFGLFVKHGGIESGSIIAFMKGDIVIMPKDCKKKPPSTHYDIQPGSHCTYTTTNADDGTVVHEFDCYVMGTGIQEPFNGQLCNHTCLTANQTCEFVSMEPVEVSMSEDGITHTLILPVVGVRTTQDIEEGTECLVNYGESMLADKQMDGFIPCKCASCLADAEHARFIML